MGLAHIRAIFFRKDLTIGEKWVLTIIGIHCNVENVCWPRLQLIADEAGMEVHNLRKIIKRLEDRKLIKRFAGKKGTKSLRFLISTTPLEGYDVPPEKVPSTPPYMEVERQERKKKGKPLFSPPPSKGDEMAKENPYKGKSMEEIKNTQIEKHVLGSVKKMNVTELRFMWMKLHAEVYPEKFTSELTVKSMDILSAFILRATPDHAEAAMFYVLKDWIGFIDYARSCGAQKGPTFPTVKYLTAWATESVNFAFSVHAEHNPPPKKKEAQKAVEGLPKLSNLKATQTSLEDFDEIMKGEAN